MATLSAHNLAKSYKARRVITDVSLSVQSGEIVGLLGPNGAGKTTTFYMIVGLIPSDTGRVMIDEQDISRLPMHGRAELGLGYLPQEASVFRKLSVSDNLMAILETRKDLNRRQRVQKHDELLEEFYITHLKNTLGMSLSGGERRRVEIARSLTTEPKFILLDEPFAGVDPISVGDIKNIIRHLKKKNIGVLITDHNVRETLAICEKAYIVGEGHIIAEGSPTEVTHNTKVRKVYLGDEFKL